MEVPASFLYPQSGEDRKGRGPDNRGVGAVGDPRVKPGVLERGILLKIRFHYDQYANLRPARSYPNVPTPVRLSTGGRLDTLVVRENTEDFYIGIGGRTQGSSLSMDLTTQRGLYSVTGGLEGGFTNGVEGVIQLGVATEPGIRRVTALAARGIEEALTSYLSDAAEKELPHEFGGEASTEEIGDRLAEGVQSGCQG